MMHAREFQGDQMPQMPQLELDRTQITRNQVLPPCDVMVRRVAHKLSRQGSFTAAELADLFEVGQAFMDELLGQIPASAEFARGMDVSKSPIGLSFDGLGGFNAVFFVNSLGLRVEQHSKDARRNRLYFQLLSVTNLALALLVISLTIIPLFKSNESWMAGKRNNDLIKEGLTIVFGAMNAFCIGMQNMCGFQAKSKKHEAAAREYNALYRASKLMFKGRCTNEEWKRWQRGWMPDEWAATMQRWSSDDKKAAEAFILSTSSRVMELEKQCSPPEDDFRELGDGRQPRGTFGGMFGFRRQVAPYDTDEFGFFHSYPQKLTHSPAPRQLPQSPLNTLQVPAPRPREE